MCYTDIMSSNIKDLISKRKDRAIAIILTVKEKECDEYLPEDVSYALRKAVLDQINSLYDLVLDVMGSLDADSVELNQHYLDMLSEVHRALLDDRED